VEAAAEASAVTRWFWALLAAVLVLAGYYLHLRRWIEVVAFLLIGIGGGVACAVVGSLLHDSLIAGQRPRPRG
jgi:hypothetical protein